MATPTACVRFIANVPSDEDISKTLLVRNLHKRGLIITRSFYLKMYAKRIQQIINLWRDKRYPILDVSLNGKYILEFSIKRTEKDDYARLWSVLNSELFGAGLIWDMFPM